MESLNTKPTLSPIDQAYLEYQNGIIQRETGFADKRELANGIVEGKISRDQVKKLKSELFVTGEDFFDYYYSPKSIIPKIEPKETYHDELVVKLKDRIISSRTFVDGGIVVGGDNQILRIDAQNGVTDVREIDNCDGIRPASVTLLPDGGILYGGWSRGVIRIAYLHQKDKKSYLKEELPKIFFSKSSGNLSCIIGQPDGKIFVEAESYDIEGISYKYFRYKPKNGVYCLEVVDDLFDSDFDQLRYSQDESRGLYYNVSGYELEVYSEKNKCLRKIDTVGPVTSADLLPNGDIVYATGNEIRILK
jgi:hypothetical protein